MRLLLNDADRLVPWAEGVIGCRFYRDARAIGWGDEDTIKAVAVYDRWSETDCCVHLASDGTGRWMTRSFLAAGFHYPFVQCGLRRMTGLVSADNPEALRLDLHMGWRREGVLRRAAPDGTDIILLGMLRSECRFILREHRGE